MARAIPTNSARTQSESVASLAVASDGGRDGFRRPGTVRRLFFFRPSSIECGGLHPRPATYLLWRQTGATDASAEVRFLAFPSVHRGDLEGAAGVDLTRSPNGRRLTAVCAF